MLYHLVPAFFLFSQICNPRIMFESSLILYVYTVAMSQRFGVLFLLSISSFSFTIVLDHLFIISLIGHCCWSFSVASPAQSFYTDASLMFTLAIMMLHCHLSSVLPSGLHGQTYLSSFNPLCLACAQLQMDCLWFSSYVVCFPFSMPLFFLLYHFSYYRKYKLRRKWPYIRGCSLHFSQLRMTTRNKKMLLMRGYYSCEWCRDSRRLRTIVELFTLLECLPFNAIPQHIHKTQNYNDTFWCHICLFVLLIGKCS